MKQPPRRWIPWSLLLAFPLFGCQTTIKGTISDQSGQPLTAPLGKVNIQGLSPTNQRFSEIIPIDQFGSFVGQQDLKPGEYLIEPLIPGYESPSIRVTSQEAENLQLRAQEIATIRTRMIHIQGNGKQDRARGNVQIRPPKY